MTHYFQRLLRSHSGNVSIWSQSEVTKVGAMPIIIQVYPVNYPVIDFFLKTPSRHTVKKFLNNSITMGRVGMSLMQGEAPYLEYHGELLPMILSKVLHSTYMRKMSFFPFNQSFQRNRKIPKQDGAEHNMGYQRISSSFLLNNLGRKQQKVTLAYPRYLSK